MYVVAFVSAQVGVGIGGLHHVDALHQSCPLVSRIAVDDNFLDCRAELDVTALFQPGGNASVVEVAHGQLLVFQQQGYQFMNVVCHEVPLGVDDEAAVLQQRRRDVHLDVLAQEPAFHLVIPPSAGRIDGGEALYDHFYAFGQVVDARQTTLVLLAHHDTLVLTQRILTQPECHQGKTQRIEVYGSRYLHLAVDDVVIHLRSGIERGAGLCRAVQLFVVLHHAGDAEIAQHQFLVFLVAEEEVAGLDVLMNDIIVMAIGQGGSTLEGYTTELIDVAVQVIVGERSALQILHQLIVAVLAVHIGLAKVGHLDDHLEVEVLDNAQQRLLDVEVGIVNLQHPLPFLAFHQDTCASPELSLKHLTALYVLPFRVKSAACSSPPCCVVVPGRKVWSPFAAAGCGLPTRMVAAMSAPCGDGCPGCVFVKSMDYLSSLISSVLFCPRITHLPPRWGLAHPHGLLCMACFQLHTQASRTPCGLEAMA